MQREYHQAMHLKFTKRHLLGALFFTLAFVLLATVFTSINNVSVSAASTNDFTAGNIVDDAVFYNKDTMTVQQIQSFLNQLIPSCDTWGTQQSGYGNLTNAQYAQQIMGWHGPPYACITNYHENPSTGETSFEHGGGAFTGGVSAAQIIYNAAQEYGINPQVLLVLLKKESAGPLTADTWPLKSQYRWAMGYGCPDSGPGYSASCDSQREGFYKQMTTAAWQLKYYKEHPNDYRYKIGWNSIQYSPDPACGTKSVYIENIATLSLYIYTPYTPNDAALANYPGTAPCGAYGNRNFFMFFSEWFGTTRDTKWAPLVDPRVMVTNKATVKINPDTGQQTQSLTAGMEIKFPLKTKISGGECLRTQSDTNNNINACIQLGNLSEFHPMLTDVSIYKDPQPKQTKVFTCKVNYQTLDITNQCFDPPLTVEFSKKVTVAGVEYFVSKHDVAYKNTTGFRADRLQDMPDQSILPEGDRVYKNVRWTCKINLATSSIDENQCFDADKEIVFMKKVTVEGTNYLVTKHDYDHKFPTVFLEERFLKVN